MRSLEVVLLAVAAVVLVIVAIPRFGDRRWAAGLTAVPIVVGAVQLVAEGFRWQMVPAYASALSLPAVRLLFRSVRRQRVIQILRVAGVALYAILLAVSVTLPALVPVFHFPAPTGPYRIGTLTYHWSDPRPEPLTADPADHRELMAQVWYPAEPAPGAARAPYLDDADAVTPALAELTGLPSFLFHHFRYVTTNAVPAAPIAGALGRYPVLVYVPGLYGFRSVSTFQVEELVSQGYIVVGLDQPGVVATVVLPGGRTVRNLPFDVIDPLVDQAVERQPATVSLDGVAQQEGLVPFFAQDVRLALDQLTRIDAADPRGVLTGHLDLSRIGIFGVSLGAGSRPSPVGGTPGSRPAS